MDQGRVDFFKCYACAGLMAMTITSDVLVVCVDEGSSALVQETADRNGWMLLDCPSIRQSVRQIMKQIIALKPKAVVLPISRPSDRALQLIRILQAGWRRLCLIVAALNHCDELERYVRQAGASCYLCDEQPIGQVNRFVEDLLDQPELRRPVPVATPPPAPPPASPRRTAVVTNN